MRRPSHIGFALLVALVFFGLCEFASRLLIEQKIIGAPAGSAQWSAAPVKIDTGVTENFARTGSGLFELDQLRGWRLVPDVERTWNAAGAVRTNSRGLRDQEIPQAKPKSEFRIVCLGDSSTFGVGLGSVDQTFAARLERMLRAGRGAAAVRVINGGCPGYTSFQGYLLLRDVLLEYQPDLVVVYLGNNDLLGEFIDDRSMVKLSLMLRIKRLAMRSAFYRVYRRGVTKSIDLPGLSDSGMLDPIVDTYSNNLRAIAMLCEQSGADVLLVTLPVQPEFLHRVEDQGERAVIGADQLKVGIEHLNIAILDIAAELDLPYVDLALRFEEQDVQSDANSYRLFTDYMHPSSSGHALIAHQLYDEIVEQDYAGLSLAPRAARAH